MAVKYNISIIKVLIAVFVINLILRAMIFPVFPMMRGHRTWGYGGPSFFYFNNSRNYSRDHRYRDTKAKSTKSVRRSSSSFRNRGTGFGK